MTDMPDAPAHLTDPELHAELRPELRQWCEAWRTCLQNVLAQISGNASGEGDAFEISSELLSATDSDLWYTVVAGGATRGEMTLRLPAASGTRLARKLLGETAAQGSAAAATTAAPTATENIPAEGISPESISPENKEALEELLRQVAGLAATALAATAGGEVQLHLSASAAPSWSSDAIVCLRTRDEAGAAITLEIQISPALAAALHARVQPAAATPTLTPALTLPVPATSAQPSSASSMLPAASSSYRRLMDVGLDVKLRFGTRRMLLRDVLALSAGVVVELDNTLHSPVDLLLDGRLIAQGEVVIVDGKYGLRITDVVDSAPAAGSPG
ncbi:MAG TPA: flagellar motor switch protein FliN [Terriglobales bacterium]|nr:flagellar motor switch protein FliN [Terriglobales bacterium]